MKKKWGFCSSSGENINRIAFNEGCERKRENHEARLNFRGFRKVRALISKVGGSGEQAKWLKIQFFL